MPVEFSHTVDSSLLEKEKIREECGLVAIYSPEPSTGLVKKAYKSIQMLQNRGSDAAGICIGTAQGNMHREIGFGLITEAIPPEKVQKLTAESCHWAGAHTRWGTFGGQEAENIQPVSAVSPQGEEIFAWHNGTIPEINQLLKKYREAIPYEIPSDRSDTHVAVHIIAHMPGENWDEKILAFSQLQEIRQSACNMIIGIGKNMYVVRDEGGMHPLAEGKVGDAYMIASETTAFDKVGAIVEREMEPGEVIKFSPNGRDVLKNGTREYEKKCQFEPFYFRDPKSKFPRREEDRSNPEKWMTTEEFRFLAGQLLAQEAPVQNATFVVGMPDSAISMGRGFSLESGAQYFQAIQKIKDGRTYLNHGKKGGEEYVRWMIEQKFAFLEDRSVWQDAVVVLVDDTLVQGNTSEIVTRMLKERFQVGEIHWRFAFPPIMHGCDYGANINESKLRARILDGDNDRIAESLGATSVSFLSQEGLLLAHGPHMVEPGRIAIPQLDEEINHVNGQCSHCVTGIRPYAEDHGTIYQSRSKTGTNIYLST